MSTIDIKARRTGLAGSNLASLLQTAGDVKTVLDLPLDKIRALKQVRTRFRKIEELADSLLEEGQQTPITVSPINEQGIYIIQKGERRFRAAQKAGLATIRAIIAAKPETTLDDVAGQLVENIQRDELDPLDLADALQQFVDQGWTHERIAKRISKPRIYVTRHLSLFGMPEVLVDLYDDEIVTNVSTLNALVTAFKEDEETALALCALAQESGGITRKQVTDALRELKETKTGSSEEQHDMFVEPDERAGEDCSPVNKSVTDEDPSELPELGTDLDDEEAQGDYEPEEAAEAAPAAPQPAPAAPATDGTPENSERIIVTGDQELSIGLSVIMDNGDTEAATLMLDSVSSAPSFAWVYLTNKKKELCVHTSRIAVTRVTAN